jgi:hypothetical protein
MALDRLTSNLFTSVFLVPEEELANVEGREVLDGPDGEGGGKDGTGTLLIFELASDWAVDMLEG